MSERGAAGESPVALGSDNHLDIPGNVNFRDAGGWVRTDGARMRLGRMYRSDDPIRTTAEGRRRVEALGLSAVIDVRQNAQFHRGPGFVEPARTFHRPLVDKVIDLDNPPPLSEPAHIADMYDDMIARSTPQLGEVLDLVADHLQTGPVLVHCVYGKDRTGIVLAMVQAALGMSRDVIVADYFRSHVPTHRRYEWMKTEPLPDDPPIGRAPAYLFNAPAETMEIFLDRVVERHGSLEAWVRSFPIAPTTIPRLQASLLT
jgi:hypothetical protein